MSFKVAILGATGAVGEALLSILAEREFPISTLYPLASARSAGEVVLFKNRSHRVLDAAEFDFSGVDFAFFSAGKEASALYAKKAAAAGCMVIDNTSLFRNDPEIPLVIPEINAHALAGATRHNIIANPNCSTAAMLMALKPIHDLSPILRVNVTTYQSVSGTGRQAISELAMQTAQRLNGQAIKPKVYPQPIAFNVIPQIDAYEPNGYTREELKMHYETRKIFENEAVMVNATAVRVPVFYGHSMAVHLETQTPLALEKVIQAFKKMPGLSYVNEQKQPVPTPVGHAASHDEVFVSRLRKDISHPNGLCCWVVGDNIRKGAALNSVQIAEAYVKGYLK